MPSLGAVFPNIRRTLSEFNLLGVDPGEVASTVAETIEVCFRDAGVEVEVKVVASQARL
jgi:hypothetical protein